MIWWSVQYVNNNVDTHFYTTLKDTKLMTNFRRNYRQERIQGIRLCLAYDKIMPNDKWWIKSESVDVVAGLTESMRSEWGGDIDLGDYCCSMRTTGAVYKW